MPCIDTLPIWSWTHPSIFVWAHTFSIQLWYYSDITVILYYNLNLLHNTVKGPFAVLHFSFSSWVKVCISCRPSGTNQWLSLGHFPPQKSDMLQFLGCSRPTCLVSPGLNAGFTSIVPLSLCFVALYNSLQLLARALPLYSSAPALPPLCPVHPLDSLLLLYFLFLLWFDH